MGISIGSLNQVVDNFTNALGDIFGTTNANGKVDPKALFKPEFGGAIGDLDRSKWTGNAVTPNKVKYGFAVVDSDQKQLFSTPYYLDIPPQAINQKEIFSTNIVSTRKGVIVESEGVIFKDIIISGTTGVFPGKRGEFNGPRANFSSLKGLASGPNPPQGVDLQTGNSKYPSTNEVSGYEEFLSLRQYFLAYAKKKVDANGNLFLIFINEKDGQQLIVEPLEFTMERNSKSPMTYNYRIVLKCLGSYTGLFPKKDPSQDLLGTISSILAIPGNIADNLSAGANQVIAASAQFPKLAQGVVGQVTNTFKKIGYAVQGVLNGAAAVIALPSVVWEASSQEAMAALDAWHGISAPVSQMQQNGGFFGLVNQQRADSKALLDLEKRKEIATAEIKTVEIQNRLNTETPTPVPREFIEDQKATAQKESDRIADNINMGDPVYNSIKGRTVTDTPGPLKVPSDEEIMFLGTVQTLTNQLNFLLASNEIFQSDAQAIFDRTVAYFTSPKVGGNGGITIQKPVGVKEITVVQGDSLERIALREYGNALRWPELVLINNLKPPYLDTTDGAIRKEGVKLTGDKILVGVR